MSSGLVLDGVADRVSSLSALEADLNAAVDRIQGEWLDHGGISRECAEQVHALLMRAREL